MTVSTVAEEKELVSYAYSYPHKSSYRALDPPRRINDVWQDEDVSALSLYVHIPFCEMRCGFCNLFTQTRPLEVTVGDYLNALARQMTVVKESVPQARFQQLAIGGGTPTLLSPRQIDWLLENLERNFEICVGKLPTSIETSPATATWERLQRLRAFGVQRVSLGVQAFSELDTQRIGRPQQVAQVHAALDRVRALSFPVLNIDLIYGNPEQSLDAWMESIESALRYRPEELYLYPLYIRPETGLANVRKTTVSHRSDLYCAARDRLREAGYRQTSLRGFRRPEVAAPSTYSCQRDGMIGLGCGARSYTQRLHYGTRFATSQAGVKAILSDWIRQSNSDFAFATHGFQLDTDEQSRRHLLLSLLQTDGLVLEDFWRRFPGFNITSLDEVRELCRREWAIQETGVLRLTELGLEKSDVVGPMLYSAVVRENLREFVRRHGEGEL